MFLLRFVGVIHGFVPQVMWTHQNNLDLTTDERNLLSVAYKKVIGTKRVSWRTITEPQPENVLQYSNFVNQLKARVEAEVDSVCADILDLLENYLFKFADRNKATEQSKVFYLKMLGDYFRYRAECADVAKGYDQKSASYYGQAFGLAETTLEPTHPVRLGLALNYSVCFYEILKQPQEAIFLAQGAFDLAISKLDRLTDDQYKDSTLILQLLRDNITLWLSEREPASKVRHI
jgi:hypothetical protein